MTHRKADLTLELMICVLGNPWTWLQRWTVRGPCVGGSKASKVTRPPPCPCKSLNRKLSNLSLNTPSDGVLTTLPGSSSDGGVSHGSSLINPNLLSPWALGKPACLLPPLTFIQGSQLSSHARLPLGWPSSEFPLSPICYGWLLVASKNQTLPGYIWTRSCGCGLTICP